MERIEAMERWTLRQPISDIPWMMAISVSSLAMLAIIFLGTFDESPGIMLWVFLIPILFCFVGLLVIGYNGRVFHDYAHMSLREYPLEIRAVETAIGLLLASKEARFKKEIRTWRARTRMQVVYLCRKMEDVTMVVEVRPVATPETKWTQVRLLHDIGDEQERKAVEDAVHAAIEHPFELRLKKYHREEEPELHVVEK